MTLFSMHFVCTRRHFFTIWRLVSKFLLATRWMKPTMICMMDHSTFLDWLVYSMNQRGQKFYCICSCFPELTKRVAVAQAVERLLPLIPPLLCGSIAILSPCVYSTLSHLFPRFVCVWREELLVLSRVIASVDHNSGLTSTIDSLS